jgi:Gpi18-like mannosyltransferase
LAEHGLARFYEQIKFCDYAPLSVLQFWGIGAVAQALGQEWLFTDRLHTLLKAPAMLGDAAIALLLFAEGRRRWGAWKGLAAAALYFVNPVSIYDSAYWGQFESVYTAMLLAAIVLAGWRKWSAAGFLSSLALLTKFQSIAILPLVIFETYRVAGWRGIGRWWIGGAIAAAIVLAPFALTGTLAEVLQRSYVRVIGQYPRLAHGAYNIWQFTGDAAASDKAPPTLMVRLVADGRTEVTIGEHWLLRVNWRGISLLLYSLIVAGVLTIFSWRAGPVGRYAAAGMLALAFYLFPTEMHERYGVPAVAFLALWAVTAAWRERVFMLISFAMLLNLAAVMSPSYMSQQIAAMSLAGFVVVIMMEWERAAGGSIRAEAAPVAGRDDSPIEPRPLIAAFRVATLAGWAIGLAATGWVVWAGLRAPALGSRDTERANVTYLSALEPRSAQQGWGRLRKDLSTDGSLISLGDQIYFRGLGTHARSKLVYDIPADAAMFRTVAGIDNETRGSGSVIIRLELDGREAYVSEVLRGGDRPVALDIVLGDARQIALVADPVDNNRNDHVSWALARFERSGQATTAAATQPSQ